MAPRDDRPPDTATPAPRAPEPAEAAKSATATPAKAADMPDTATATTTDTATTATGKSTTLGGRKLLRRLMIGAIALVGPVAALALGLFLYLTGGRYVATDNAYVKSAKIAVSADISGRVVDVAVSENETVTPGTVLFRIDPAPFRIALDEAEARLLAACQDVEALRAAYRGNIAALERAKGDVAFHEQQVARQRGLSTKRLVSDSSYDAAKRALRNAHDDVKVAEQALAEARAKLAGNPDIAVADHPSVKAAKAARNRAALDLARTEVKATVAGIVTNFDLQPGEYVETGDVVFSLVGTDETWVHANYKETELTHVRVGQPATVAVDTYPGRVFEGRVVGISPATGAEFALLPPQNATGNWVKVVQRLTVRIRLDQPATDNAGQSTAPGDVAPPARLRAGMSAHVEIDTGHQRRLTGLLGPLSDWLTPVAEARP
jgi:membrane fusion protein (multidrug efflux system)